MNRMLRNSFYFLLGFLLSALVTIASAETIPATLSGQAIKVWAGGSGVFATLEASGPAACASTIYYPDYVGVVSSNQIRCSNTNANGTFYQNYTRTQLWICPSVPQLAENATIPTSSPAPSCPQGYTCPSGQNWTLNGQTCTRPDCVAPQTRQSDGTCSAPQCTHSANAQVGGMYVIPRPVPSGVIWCASNCLVYMVTDSYSPTETFAKAYVNGAGGAASSCTGSSEVVPTPKEPEPTKTPTPCAHGQGVITNSAGKVVCVDQNAVPSAEPPKVNKTIETKTHPDGSQTINNITQTCTGEGACSTTTTTTTTNASNGQPGIAGTPGTTTATKDKPSETQSDFCAQNPSLQICKGGMATEALQKETLDEIKKLNNPTASDDSPISSKTFESTPGRSDLTTHDDSLKNYVIGAVVPGEVAASKGAWETAMSSGWFDPIERGGCQPYVATIAGKTWTWDYCQKADEIAQIGAYALWVSLAFGIFVMLTGGQRS